MTANAANLKSTLRDAAIVLRAVAAGAFSVRADGQLDRAKGAS